MCYKFTDIPSLDPISGQNEQIFAQALTSTELSPLVERRIFGTFVSGQKYKQPTTSLIKREKLAKRK